jgi:hypothetical protein
VAEGYADDLTAAEAQLERVVRRLRHMSARAWRATDRARAAHDLAQLLAEVGQGVEERAQPAPPQWRAVPDLADHALPDAVAVTGHDALAALRSVTPETQVWTPAGRAAAADLLAAVVRALGPS